MAKSTERETYDPNNLKADFPSLVTAMALFDNGTLYVYVTDSKAQTKIRNLSLVGRWTCGGYGVSHTGSLFVRFVQLKAKWAE